jgi:hypothetical protein
MVGDWDSKKELLENPCHTVGLMGSGAQSDDQILRNVAVQGFKYGIVLSEHTTAEHLYVHNCEHGVAIASATHPILINRILAQHNQRIFSILPHGTFGRIGRTVYLKVNQCAFERGEEYSVPVVSNMKYAVYDPDNRLYGSLEYMQGWPGRIDKCFFPMRGGKNFKCTAIGEKRTDEPHRGVMLLTFDDNNISQWLKYLDLFDKYGARASFFPSGKLSDKDIEGLKKIKARGHAVGVHGVNHKSFSIVKPTKEDCEKYYNQEFLPQIKALAAAGIEVKCAAMPNNRHNHKIDNFLIAQGFKRIRVGGEPMNRNYWRNATAFGAMKVMRGKGVGEFYGTDIEKLLAEIEYASDSNSIYTLFSHSIAPDAKNIHMKAEWLEQILASCKKLGMRVVTLED